MKIAVISPSYREFLEFVSEHCIGLGVDNVELVQGIANVDNGIATFNVNDGTEVKKVHYLWLYSLFTPVPNPKLILSYDMVVCINDRIDNEMKECYDFLVERNPNAAKALYPDT